MKPEEIQKMLDDKFTAVQTELKTAREQGATKVELEKLIDKIEVSGNALDSFIESQKTSVVKNYMAQFNEFLGTNKDKLDEIKLNKAGTIEFTPKAVGDISRGSGTQGAGTVPNVMMNNLGSFDLRDDSALLGLATVTSTNSPALAYTELIPKEGGYAFVAEAGTKPQTDFKWENRQVTPYKTAAYEVLSEESVTDVARLESVAREYLSKTHDLKKVNQLYFGGGTGNDPSGATVTGRTFVSTGMVDKFALGTSNFMDVVNAIITDVYRTQAYTDQAHFQPNIVLINPIDFFLNLVGAKDGEGLPLYPQAGLFNEVRIGGVVIRPWITIPAGKILVADMKKMNVVNYVPFSIRVGWINDQFITNEFTMVGESRYYQYVKNLDAAAFVYDDIATVQAAITAAV
jgi:HK97 family phage major capsid protein